ncbi:MAG: hypothetical protein MJ089_05660 [Ruminococcus sp.]|nr:hypothetical protein [Ruminococcus sp.]
MKLPVCPYCHTVYRYGDVKGELSKKKHNCYNCKNKFKISVKAVVMLFVVIEIICAFTDIGELFLIKSISFPAIMITNIVINLVGIILIPYFVVFRAEKGGEIRRKSPDTKSYRNKRPKTNVR